MLMLQGTKSSFIGFQNLIVLTFKKLAFVDELWCSIKEYPQLSEVDIKIHLLFATRHRTRPNFLHILQLKQHILTDFMQKQI